MSKDGETVKDETLIRPLFEAGAHFGYSKSRNHSSTRDFIFAYKNRSAIIDLEKTMTQLTKAKEFLAELGKLGKKILLVGNKSEVRSTVEIAAQKAGLPYVTSRWLGGTFTNFAQIKSRIDRMIDLKSKRELGELSVYTKKEQLLFSQEITKLERYLASLASLTALPAAVVVIDSEHEKIVVKEANKTKIPVVSVSNTDCDLRGLDYPIVANDGNIDSVKLILGELMTAYEGGK
jgi:small subunit ribosomal protein S2